MATGGDVFVLDMGRPVRIDDLARRMINLMGLTVRDADNSEGDIEIVYTGLRSAEKLFEELLIGGNVTKTDHAMIMRAMEHSLPWSHMAEILGDLQAAIAQSDCREVLNLLREAVAEYRPAESIRDHLWTRGAVQPAAAGADKVADFAAKRRQVEGHSGQKRRLRDNSLTQ
jgi:FlaA1/EpsC-like NDP-sugar epimerase